jgi:hypothetical protein
MDTREVQSVMTEMENGLSKEGVCLKPKFDLKYMFTVDSKIDDPRTKASCSLESVFFCKLILAAISGW